jgi:hypothetical protein
VFALNKLSAILIEMASMILRPSRGAPSVEAGHAALLLAHVGWNREIDPAMAPTREQYRALLREFAESKPDFGKDLKSYDFEALIEEMRSYKRSRHPVDKRLIMVCGMTPNGNVHVEWKE